MSAWEVGEELSSSREESLDRSVKTSSLLYAFAFSVGRLVQRRVVGWSWWRCAAGSLEEAAGVEVQKKLRGWKLGRSRWSGSNRASQSSPGSPSPIARAPVFSSFPFSFFLPPHFGPRSSARIQAFLLAWDRSGPTDLSPGKRRLPKKLSPFLFWERRLPSCARAEDIPQSAMAETSRGAICRYPRGNRGGDFRTAPFLFHFLFLLL